jgi:predicted GIY-YIG superfamily endonuclease
MGFMYIVECADRSYYVGSTRDLDRRLAEHNSGNGAEYTKRRIRWRWSTSRSTRTSLMRIHGRSRSRDGGVGGE